MKHTAPERWPDSPGRGLDGDFRFEAFSCQVCCFSVLLWAREGLAEGSDMVKGSSRRYREA